ncbi:MAG: hypothetical protein K2Z81_21410 [Cyanobacteria bacterium]|nr:hypothetical protein [Cyanobacteriota bacterium]
MKFSRICFVLLLTFTSMPASAVESWQNESRIAHVLVEENHVGEALRKFDDAIRILKSTGGDTAVSLDLELNKAEILTSSGRFGDAWNILKRVEPLIKNCKRETLQVRYYRRVSRLTSAQGHFAESIRIRKMNLQLMAAFYGRDNSTYVRELHDLLSVATEAKSWSDAIEAASELKQFQATCANPVNKQLLTRWLQDFFDLSIDMFRAQIQKGDLAEAERFLNLFGSCARTSLSSTKFWLELFKSSMVNNQSQFANACMNDIRRLAESGKLSTSEAGMIACEYLRYSLGDVYNEIVSARTELLLEEACRILKLSSKPTVLESDTLYIQCSSLYAVALARRGKIEQAGSVLENLRLDPSYIKDISQLNGISQARHALAVQRLKSGDNAAAHLEYQKLYKLVRSLPQLKAREAAVRDLQRIEQASIP